MFSGHHSSGKLKQTNKVHKGSLKSKRAQKRALGPGKVETAKGGGASKGSAGESFAKTNRLNRINREQQLRKQKRDAVLLQKRLGSDAGPPKIVAIVPLAHTVNVKALLDALVAEAHATGAGAGVGTVNVVEMKDAAAADDADTDAKTVVHATYARYKTKLSFVAADFDLFSTLDALKVADVVLFVVDVRGGAGPVRGANAAAALSGNVDAIVSAQARTLLTAIKAQGCPEALCCVQGMETFQSKSLADRRKFVHRVLEAEVLTGPASSRVFEFAPPGTAHKAPAGGISDGVAQLARQLCSLSPKDVTWRSVRSYLVSTRCDDAAKVVGSSSSSAVVRVEGYLRGRPLPVNSLVHVVGVGTGRVTQVAVGARQASRRGTAAGGDAMQDSLLLAADRERQDALVLEAAADGISGEQTWPSEAEMGQTEGGDDPAAGRNRRRVPHSIPVGMSAYQADWFVDDEGHFSEGEDEDGGGVAAAAGGDAMDDADAAAEHDDDDDADDGGIADGLADLSAADLAGNRRPVVALDAVQKRVAQATSDKEFPDEMDTPDDVPARERFARYRALQSFRSSPWHPKENLPIDYARIYQFDNFGMAQRRILEEGRVLDGMQRRAVLEGRAQRSKDRKSGSAAGSAAGSVKGSTSLDAMDTDADADGLEAIDGPDPSSSSSSSSSSSALVPGTDDVVCVAEFVTMDIDFTGAQLADPAGAHAAAARRLAEAGYLAVFALLRHENKLSVLHCHVQRCDDAQAGDDASLIKSKDELVFHVGCRTFSARPVFSEANLNSDKHKFERFWRGGGGFSIASVFAPITFMPSPVLIFRPAADCGGAPWGGSTRGLQLVGIGTVGGVDPDRIVLKKVILTGLPIRVRKKFAVVKHLFHDPQDVRWFKPAEMVTKHGLRGHIKEPVGTHGLLKASFSAPIKQNDTVMLVLYKRVYPKLPPAQVETTAGGSNKLKLLVV